uniref:Uncharacterized protein n=1 Tax=uncultured marine virus TaxID=186617 RepID=A0A0F7L985_9VIRU|nr:hypothetical protein [uncultured marine virus]
MKREVGHADSRQRARRDNDQVAAPVDRLDEVELFIRPHLEPQVTLSPRFTGELCAGEVVDVDAECFNRLHRFLEDQFRSQFPITLAGRCRALLDRLPARLHKHLSSKLAR